MFACHRKIIITSSLPRYTPAAYMGYSPLREVFFHIPPSFSCSTTGAYASMETDREAISRRSLEATSKRPKGVPGFTEYTVMLLFSRISSKVSMIRKYSCWGATVFSLLVISKILPKLSLEEIICFFSSFLSRSVSSWISLVKISLFSRSLFCSSRYLPRSSFFFFS